MKTKIFKKPLSLIFAITILIGCNSEEELPPVPDSENSEFSIGKDEFEKNYEVD